MPAVADQNDDNEKGDIQYEHFGPVGDFKALTQKGREFLGGEFRRSVQANEAAFLRAEMENAGLKVVDFDPW